MKQFILFTLLFAASSTFSQVLDSVEYSIDGQKFTAFYAKPTKITKKTKTILIVHEWWGLNDYPKSRALQIAREGNIGFCIDMYGKGKIAANPKDAQALATPFYKDSDFSFNRFMAGYNQSLKIEGVDSSKIVAIGYCFGGSVVLNAAKMGAPIDGVASFHGGLAGIPVDKSKLKAAVLVCNGAADSFVPVEEINEFKKQMTEAGADLTFIDYPEATHAFTNPNATATGKKFSMPISYNAAADKQSWIDFNQFMKTKVK
ncbi:dienelactone hydrolase family protein [Fluviicola taffensis]|uniref:Dienelactone hydrolase n=1 Tax=Fluviicola taffensis (strain DSM 16823 / NCIMB 13979 / RW262) TaxID=755732 RepID=F2ID24_FLUTR|nr:dienelactone hydrolase family protein [Fluviicola taffensis]AEA44418.1 dienelactone hydrolase [Fluviicola taffensis DSM 16823]